MAEQDWKALIEGARATLGPPPRKYGLRDRVLWKLFRPDGLGFFSPLKKHYAHQGKLRDSGRVVWGALVQANNKLFEPGGWELPAELVYSLDPSFDDQPDELLRIAEGIFAFKAEPHADPEIDKWLARHVRNEKAQDRKVLVPRALRDEREVFATTLVIHQDQLPGGCLVESILPLLVLPEATDAVRTLPKWCWDAGHQAMWGEGADSGEEG